MATVITLRPWRTPTPVFRFHITKTATLLSPSKKIVTISSPNFSYRFSMPYFVDHVGSDHVGSDHPRAASSNDMEQSRHFESKRRLRELIVELWSRVSGLKGFDGDHPAQIVWRSRMADTVRKISGLYAEVQVMERELANVLLH